jgi:hypothetical protein
MSEELEQARVTRTVSPPSFPQERLSSLELSSTRKNFHERNLEHLKSLTSQNSKRLSDLQEEKRKLELARQRLAQKVLKRNAESKIKSMIKEEKIEEDRPEGSKPDLKSRNLEYIQALQESNKAKLQMKLELEERKVKEMKKLRTNLGLHEIKSKIVETDVERPKVPELVEKRKNRLEERKNKLKEEMKGKKDEEEKKEIEKKQKKSDEQSFQRLTQMPKRFSNVPIVTDMIVFKKKNGLSENDRVFIINGCYPDIRKALLKRSNFYLGRLV